MTAVFWRTLRDRWRMLVAMVMVGVLSQWMYIALYPTYSESFSQSQDLFQNMPEAFKKVINMDTFSMDTLEKYLTMEMYSMFWLILSIIFIISLAGTALAGDVERETIVQSAAQPISRTRVYLGKYLAAAAMFTVFNVSINAVVIPLAAVFNVAAMPSHYLVVGVMGELFGLALLGMSFGLSAFLADKGRSHAILGGALLVMYVLNIVSGLRASLDNLKFGSIFHYFNPNTFLVHGEYEATAIAVFAGLAVAGLAFGWWRFTHRDIS